MGGLPQFILELREFIRRLNVAGDMVREARHRVEALEQAVRDRPRKRLGGAALSGQVLGCNSLGFPGASVVVSDATTGVTLTTTTADSNGNYTVGVTLSASGQTLNVTGIPTGTYASRFSGTGTVSLNGVSGANSVPSIVLSPATGYCCGVPGQYQPDTINCTCSGTTRICVTLTDGCASPGNVAGATITVKDGGGSTVGTCTTNASGQCCVTLTASGVYTVIASVPGATNVSTSVTALCNVDTAVNLSFNRISNAIGTACFNCTECDSTGSSNVSGATVSITGHGTASGTTNASGQACFALGAGTYSATITYPDGYTKTVSFVVSSCATTTVNVTAVKAMCVSVINGTPGCVVTFTLSGGASGSCSTTINSGHVGNCCITFSPVDLNTGATLTIATSGTFWNGSSQSVSLACYTTASPFAMDFGSQC